MFRVPSLWGDCSQRKMELSEGKCSPLSAQNGSGWPWSSDPEASVHKHRILPILAFWSRGS